MNPAEMSKNQLALHRRAMQLCKPLEHTTSLDNIDEVLVFKLSDERYAIATRYIKEVFPLGEYTSLPGTPAFLLGLVNLRRKIIPVIDLRVFFDLSTDAKDKLKLILLGNSEKEFALVADHIEGIQHIPLTAIEAPPPTLSGIRQELLFGVSLERIAILDGAKLLASQRLMVEETVDVISNTK